MPTWLNERKRPMPHRVRPSAVTRQPSAHKSSGDGGDGPPRRLALACGLALAAWAVTFTGNASAADGLVLAASCPAKAAAGFCPANIDTTGGRSLTLIGTLTGGGTCTTAATNIAYNRTTPYLADGTTLAISDMPVVRSLGPKFVTTFTEWTGQIELNGVTRIQAWFQNASSSACDMAVYAGIEPLPGAAGASCGADAAGACYVQGGDWLTDGGHVNVDNTVATTGGGSGGTVALSADDSDRLDLIWWGVWIAAGLLVAALVAPHVDRLFPWHRAPQ